MNPTNSSPSRRFANLDILRHFAALDVVYAHAFTFPALLPYDTLINPVPTFLCISGFLIPASLQDCYDRGHGWGLFAWKRALRIVPAFLLSMILVGMLDGWNWHHLWLVFAFYLTMGAFGANLNGPIWSLMLEECVYTFHAVSRRIFTPAFSVFGLVGSTALLWIFRDTPMGQTSVLHHLSPIPAFFAGNLLHHCRDWITTPSWSRSGIILAAFAGLRLMPFHPAFYVVGSSLGAVLAVSLALSVPQWQPKFKTPDLSYGTYVFHYPILMALIPLGIVGWALFGATVAIVLPLAGLSWYLVESPALKWKTRLPSRKTREAKELEPAVALDLHPLIIGPVEDYGSLTALLSRNAT